jgi:hypothetical protein
MGGGESATHTHRQEEGRDSYAHHDIGDRFGEACVPITRGGCARASGAQPTHEAQSVGARGGESVTLCDRDGGGRECASLGAGV